MKKAFIVGASGATGKLLVKQLLDNQFHVITLVRPSSSFGEEYLDNPLYTKISGEISHISDEELKVHLSSCDTFFSCLGHNLTFKGLFGEPKKLVTDAIKKITKCISDQQKCKLILMNTTGNCNLDIPEKPPLSQRIVVTLLRHLLPPHADNETAANFLRTEIGQNHSQLEWTVVRPDGLINEDQVSDYDIHPSPIRNVIFNAGKTSRINVANFMFKLASNDLLWNQWKGQMPVIYNRE